MILTATWIPFELQTPDCKTWYQEATFNMPHWVNVSDMLLTITMPLTNVLILKWSCVPAIYNHERPLTRLFEKVVYTSTHLIYLPYGQSSMVSWACCWCNVYYNIIFVDHGNSLAEPRYFVVFKQVNSEILLTTVSYSTKVLLRLTSNHV